MNLSQSINVDMRLANSRQMVIVLLLSLSLPSIINRVRAPWTGLAASRNRGRESASEEQLCHGSFNGRRECNVRTMTKITLRVGSQRGNMTPQTSYEMK